MLFLALQEQLEKEMDELDEKYSSLCDEKLENEKERIELESKNSCLQVKMKLFNLKCERFYFYYTDLERAFGVQIHTFM
jgi:mRNA-degrading endonuclease RelE of RelBE toxin-antitoxin system